MNPSIVRLVKFLPRVYMRYSRPIFISETGTEDSERPKWMAYVANEVHASQVLGVTARSHHHIPGGRTGRHRRHDTFPSVASFHRGLPAAGRGRPPQKLKMLRN